MSEDGHATVARLREIIRVSTTGSSFPLSKGILAFLLQQSGGLTRNVHCTLTDGLDGFTRRIRDRVIEGVYILCDPSWPLQMNQVLAKTGTNMQFFYCFGRFVGDGKYSVEGQHPGGQDAFPGWPAEAYRKSSLPDSTTFFLANTSRKIDPQSFTCALTLRELEAYGSNKRPKPRS